MSDFKFDCPKCGQNIVCDTSNAGMQIPCPACQNVLTVPAPPPVARVAPEPGKLSIKKTAHHAPTPPPPGAANAPAKPAWGTKPAAPPPSAKKFPWVPISVVAGLLVVGCVGWFGFGAPYLQKKAEEKKQAEEQKARDDERAKVQAALAAAKARRAKAEWNLDLAEAQFPERPAAGKIHGVDFKVDLAAFQNGFLTLRQSAGSTRQFQISVPLKTGEKLAGKSIQVATAETGPEPRIVMSWKEESPKPPGAQAFAKGYAMKLEFGEVADGGIPGKIYLCVPDDEQSFVAGSFEIGGRKPGARPPGAPPGTQPPPRRRPPPPQ